MSRLGARLIAEARFTKWEARIERATHRALAVHRRRVEADVRRSLTAAAPPVDPFDAAVWTDTLGRELVPVLHSVFAEIGQGTLSGFFDDPSAYPPVDLTLHLERMLGHMQGLGPEMADRLGATLAEGFNAGEGWQNLDRRVRDTFGVGERRASTIARTETVGAANGASHDVARTLVEGGLDLEKEWLATGDRRTRPSHLAADGQRVPFDSKFEVGSCLLDHPHDPAALGCAEEIVNCRCTTLYPEREQVTDAEPEPVGDAPSRFTADTITTTGGKAVGPNTKVAKGVRTAKAAIDGVHRSPDLGITLDVHQTSGERTLGLFSPVPNRMRRLPDGSWARLPGYINVSSGGAHQALTFAHEFGHMFDYFDWGEAKRYTSSFAASPDNPLRPWIEAVQESPSLKRWQRHQAGEPLDLPDGRKWRIPRKHMNYLLQPLELWARSYAQFIAMESGNPVLMAELRRKQAEVFTDQWTDAEFEPIRAAIRAVFRAQGLMD